MSGDRVIRAGLVVSLTVVTTVAVVISYGHLYALAKSKGETGAAAATLPITVDGLVLAASLVILNAARNRSRPPVLAWLLLLAGIGATLAGNIAHGITHGWSGSVVAGWPAAVAAGMFHLAIGEIRRGREIVLNVDNVHVENDLAEVAEPDLWEEDDHEGVADGYSLWATIEPEPEPTTPALPWWPLPELPAATVALPAQPLPNAATDDQPELPCDSQGSPEPVPAVPDVPGDVIDRALEVFRGDLDEGRIPSIRRIKDGLNVGQDRAKRVREYLTVLPASPR